MITTHDHIARSARPPAWRVIRALVHSLAWLQAGAALLSSTSALAAGPGSGAADLSPPTAVVAGATGSWVITYRAEEGFPHSNGGAVDVEVPADWTPPTLVANQPGEVTVSSPHVSSATIVPPRTIRLIVGEAPFQKFNVGDSVRIVYGGGGGAGVTASTTAPATALFHVYSDPNTGDGITTAEIAGGPLSVELVPDALESVRIEDAAGNAIGGFTRSADEDTTQLYLRGFDSYGNPLGLVSGDWSVSGTVGSVSPIAGSMVTLQLTSAGSGTVTADVGGTTDATGTIVVTPGAYVALRFSAPGSAGAGTALPVSADAIDADGNVVDSGPGSAAALRVVAFAASVGGPAAGPDFVDDAATLTAGQFSGAVTPRRAGNYWVAVRDEGTGFESARFLVTIGADAPHHLSLTPGSLTLVAGVPDTVTVESRDLYENPSPVAADEILALWSNRPAGQFQDLGGGSIFEVTIPSGASAALFRFRDTQSVTAGGRIRAIDTGLAPPYLGTGEATVATLAADPASSVAVSATPDSLEADGVATSGLVSATVRDSFGNAIPAGAAFTVDASLLAPLGDADAGTPGIQWISDASGIVSGLVQAGTTKGSGSVSLASIAGSATGSTPVTLLAGAPSGSIALSAAPAAIPADGAATALVSAAGLTDVNGNQVEDGERYTVGSDLGTIATVDADAGTPGVQVEASSGSIVFTLQAGATLGVSTVTVASVRGAASGSTPVALQPGAVNGAISAVTATSPAPVGGAGSSVTVTLRDAQGHPLPGIPADSIALTVSGVSAAVSALAATTDASGAILFQVTTLAADTGSVSVTALGQPLSSTASIVFLAGAVDHYTVDGPAPPLLAGRAESLIVTARDLFENAATAADGSRLSIRVIGGVAIAPDTVAFSGAVTSVPFTPTAVTQITLLLREVTAPLRSVMFGPVTVSPAGPYAIDSLAVAAATLATGDSTLVELWIDDAYGNRQPGAAVSATVLAGGGSASPASAITDAAGRALIRIHAGQSPGALSIRFLAVGSPAPDAIRADTVSVVVTAGTAASIEISPSTGGIVAGGLLNVSLTLRDAFGNVATGATPLVRLRTSTPLPLLDNVRWSLTAGAAGVLADSVASDEALYQFAASDSGTAVVALRDTLAETIVLRAGGTTLPLAETAPVTILPAPPTLIAVVSGNGQAGVVAAPLSQPLRVRARDSFGNATPGAVVQFTITGGGGTIDVVAGGGVDSDAIADTVGLASADVWRLGTLAGAGQSARATLAATPSSFVPFSATGLPDTAFSLTLAPGVLGLAPTQTAAVTATARDAYGNVVPGELLTLYLAGPAHGTLQPVGGATTGGPGSQSGSSDALGRVPIRYAAPSAAPAVDSIYVRSATLAPVGIRATTSAGATTSLRVSADSLTWTAGSPVRIRVEALDAQGNLVLGDAATVILRSVSGVVFAPVSGPLVAGSFESFATASVVGSIASIGADRSGSPGVGGSTGPVSVRPAPPAGTIPVLANRTTLTADGRSLATVTFGPVLDAYANVVAPGTALAASVSAGTLAGGSLTTDVAGMASTVLIAPNAPGAGTLSVVSVLGGASGSLGFTYVAPPALTAMAATLAPVIVTPGGAAAFQLDVTNTGSGAMTLGAGTSLSFGPASSVVNATFAGAPLVLGPGAAATLAFVSTIVPVSFVPGSYAPTLRAIGIDATGDPFDFYPTLAGASIHVAGIRVTAVGAAPTPVPLGYGDLQLTFSVENLAAADAVIESAGLVFSQGTFTVNGVTPALPLALGALGTRTLVVSLRVPTAGIASGASVDASLTAGVRYGTVVVSGTHVPPLPVPVVSAASLAPLAGGTAPARFLRGRTFAPSARVRNNGSADVTLFRDQTLFVLGHAAGDTLRFRLLANQVVAGGDEATLAFDSLAVPASTALGVYGAEIRFLGSESGQPFAANVAGNPVGMAILDPAILSITGLSPDSVSAGQSRPIRITVTNGGGVDYAFDASTTLRLGNPVSTTLTLAAPATAPAGGGTTLDFVAAPLGVAGSPGTAAATLEVRGREDGWPRDENLAAGMLEARSPALLAFVAGSTSPDTIRAGQTVTISAAVRNDGGSPFLLDPAATRLVVTDNVESAAGFATGAPFSLAPGAQAALSFPSVAFPAALASQPYPVALEVTGSEWGLAVGVTLGSPSGEIRIVEPAAALQVRAIDPGAPKQAASGAGALRLWSLEFDPLVPVGGAASTRLESVALTLLVDGVAAAVPGGAVTLLEVRDAGGTLLAQTVPTVANPVSLLFTPPIDLSVGAVTLFLDVTLAAGLEAGDVALRLAAEGDVVARDNLSGTSVPVRATGGLPFQALDSRRVTLFAKAHGYPNPFRAGRESVRLSYRLGADASVRVRIVTLLGELVRELSFPAGGTGGLRGLNEVPWDGTNGAGAMVKPGVYVARISSTGGGGVSEVVKVGVRR